MKKICDKSLQLNLCQRLIRRLALARIRGQQIELCFLIVEHFVEFVGFEVGAADSVLQEPGMLFQEELSRLSWRIIDWGGITWSVRILNWPKLLDPVDLNGSKFALVAKW